MSEATAPSLPPPRRVVTGHNPNGQATVAFDSHLTPQPVGDNNLTILWSTSEHPANVNGSEDAALSPRTEGVFHRSTTLDYVIVGKGSVVLSLDDGSKVTLNEGDMVVQRATMHSWSNTTDQWARIYGMMVPAQAPIVNGKELKEDWPF